MNINIISVKELRENFPVIRKGLKEKRVYLLVYRSKPLAKLLPFDFEEESESVQGKPEFSVKKLAGGLKLGKDLTPKKINKLLQEKYAK